MKLSTDKPGGVTTENKPIVSGIFFAVIILLIIGGGYASSGPEDKIRLPAPVFKSEQSIESTLLKRRSVRDFKDEPLRLAEVSQLLWAAQGVTDLRGFRTSPSAGALYPLELYLLSGNVDGLPDGIYKYIPLSHKLLKVAEGDKRNKLAAASLGQSAVKDGAAVIVFSAVYRRTTRKYGSRGNRYVHIETGHAAQNIYLQAVSLNLGTVIIGAFNDNEVKRILKMKPEEKPLCIMPVGRK
jgi:SagB-type dehydrogenase family enzyme